MCEPSRLQALEAEAGAARLWDRIISGRAAAADADGNGFVDAAELRTYLQRVGLWVRFGVPSV